MRTSAKMHFDASQHNGFPRYLIAILAFTLLAIGSQKLLAELSLVGGSFVKEKLSDSGSLSAEELNILEQSRISALEFLDIPNAYDDLSFSYFIRASQQSDLVEQRKYAELSISASTKSLQLSPLNTFTWLRLTSAYLLMGEAQHCEALQAWRNSIELARFEPFLMTQRIHSGVLLYSIMGEEERLKLKEQVNLAYKWNRYILRQYANENGLKQWILFLGPSTKEARQFLGAIG